MIPYTLHSSLCDFKWKTTPGGCVLPPRYIGFGPVFIAALINLFSIYLSKLDILRSWFLCTIFYILLIDYFTFHFNFSSDLAYVAMGGLNVLKWVFHPSGSSAQGYLLVP